MSGRARAFTVIATLIVAAGAWLVWMYAPRLAVGPVLGDLRLLIAALAVLAFLTVADAVLQRILRRRSDP